MTDYEPKAHDVIMEPNNNAYVRFWGKVDRRGDDECWEWVGGRFWTRYGQFHLGPVRSAHRASWILNRGPIPDGMQILHTCDNPPCVNPAHLFLGTHSDNMEDMRAKGRHRYGAAGFPIGVSHPRAKLTDDDVREMRAARETGETFESLGLRFGVSRQHAHLVCTNGRRAILLTEG